MDGISPVTLIIIAVTCLVSWAAFNNPKLMSRLLLWPTVMDRQKQYDRLITHGFIHADFMHLLFNMLTLYFFGPLIEMVVVSRIGYVGFLVFYVSAIVVAALPSYFRHRTDPGYRSLGASGAVSAVLFAFILLSPWSLIFVFFIPMPAIIYAVVYTAYSIYMDKRGGDNINHSAHLTGAAYGVVFIAVLYPQTMVEFVQKIAHPSFG